MSEQKVVVTLPADQQQVDQTDYVYSFVEESPHPERIWEGALIVAGDEDNPFIARVVDIIERPGGRKVHLEPICTPEEIIDELRHCGFLKD